VREQLIQARAELAALLQLPAETLPEAQGALTTTGAFPYTLERLLAAAAERPRLRALDHREQAARSRLDLERAAVWPDVTVGVFSGREGPGEARERIAGVSVSLPLPLFRRNAGGIGKANGGTRPGADRAAGRRPRHARDACSPSGRSSAACASARSGWSESVLQRLQENQRLSAAAYRAGEISLTQLLLATRQVLDTRREVLEAATDFALTRIELEQAAGWRGGQ
jgi:cobalt-zinc-cadmium efflux system outer membrane protein